MKLLLPSNLLLLLGVALVLMDESAALPLVQEEHAEIATQRKLLATPVEVALAEAERLGSGETTFQQLTSSVPSAQVRVNKQPDALALFKREAAKPQATPVQHQDALSLFNLEAQKNHAPDPLETFEQKRALVDAASEETSQLVTATSAATAEAQRERSLLQGFAAPSVVPAPSVATASHEVMDLSARDPLSDALANFDKEESATLKLPSLQVEQPHPEAPVAATNLPQDSDDNHDLGESAAVGDFAAPQAAVNAQPQLADDDVNDLGESSDMDVQQGSLDKQIDEEASAAAKQVLKETMKNVENDFLMSEKQLTKDGSQAPALTLDALRKPSATAARLQKQRKEGQAHAKQEAKKMKLEAKLAYDRAIAAAHKTAKEQLDHILSGLRMQFAVRKKSLEEDAKIKIQQAKQSMLDQIKTADVVAVNRLKATLPMKLAKAKQQAEAQAQHVASVAIQQITSENKKIRNSLQRQLGEANAQLNAAKLHLTNSDANPAQALQNAVAVKTQKEHVRRLGELANVALSQQKARSASEVSKAQEDAKESVRLAMKKAKKSALAEAQAHMDEERQKIRNTAEATFREQETKIKGETAAKVSELQKETKELVDAAMQKAPLREQELHRRATNAYKQAKNAADNYLAKALDKYSSEIKVTDGSTVNRDVAESALEDPADSKAFTLQNQNFEAAAKFAARKARQAKRKLEATKKKSQEIMEELQQDTKAAKQAAVKAEALDEKVTRIKLAKLQLNEARAASAFNKAARAHLEEELAKKKISKVPSSTSKTGPEAEFKNSLKALQKQARTTTQNAFKEAKQAASELANTPTA